MLVLPKIAYHLNRKDQIPNQELAAELAHTKNKADIRELAENMWHSNKNVQADCLKVLYEIGYLDRGLIVEYAPEFIKLLDSKQNRMVWGAMIALSIIAPVAHKEIGRHYTKIKDCMAKGSVITVDNGVQVLAILASLNPHQAKEVFDFLIDHLTNCRPKELPQHAEKSLVAVNAGNKERFIATLAARLPVMSKTQSLRLNKVIRQASEK